MSRSPWSTPGAAPATGGAPSGGSAQALAATALAGALAAGALSVTGGGGVVQNLAGNAVGAASAAGTLSVSGAAGTSAPVAPIIQTLVDAGGSQFTVTWDAPQILINGDPIANDPVTNFKIYWGTTPGAQTGPATVSGSTYTYTGGSAGALYVKVSAVNSYDEGWPSTERQVTVA